MIHGVNKASVENNTDPITLSVSPVGVNRLLVLTLHYRDNEARAGGSPTFNGTETFTQVDSVVQQADGGGGQMVQVEMWYLVNPTATTANISVPNTNTIHIRLNASWYVGVDQTSPYDTYNSATGTTSPSCTMTPNYDGNLVIDGVTDGNASSESACSHILLNAVDEGQTNTESQFMFQRIAGQITMTYTIPDDNWAMIMASFKPIDSTVVYKYPDGDENTLWSYYPSTPTSRYDKVDDPIGSPDDNSTYVYTPSVYPQIFGFPSFSVPTGSTIQAVFVFQREYSSTGNHDPTALLRVSSIYDRTYTGSGKSAYFDFLHSWANNPNTSSAWTVTDVNSGIDYYGINNTTGSPTRFCTQCLIGVDYITAGTTVNVNAQTLASGLLSPLAKSDTLLALTAVILASATQTAAATPNTLCSPSTLNISGGLHSPSLKIDVLLSMTAKILQSSQISPSLKIDVLVSVLAQALSASLYAPTAGSIITVNPSCINLSAALQSALAKSDCTFPASLLSCAAAQPGATVTPNTIASVTTQVLASAVLSPSVKIDVVLSIAAQVLQAAQLSPSFKMDVLLSIVTQVLASGLYDPTVLIGGGAVTVYPACLEFISSLLAPNIKVDATVSPSLQSIVSALQSITVTPETMASLSTQVLNSDLLSPALKADVVLALDALSLVAEQHDITITGIIQLLIQIFATVELSQPQVEIALSQPEVEITLSQPEVQIYGTS